MNVKILKEFSRTNISLAILINILTLGFYEIFWLQQRASFLRSKLPQNILPVFEITAAYLLLVLIYIHSIAYIYLYLVIRTILLFEVREKIYKLTRIDEKNKLRFSTTWTFVFGFLYMIYKIDQFPATRETPGNPNINHK